MRVRSRRGFGLLDAMIFVAAAAAWLAALRHFGPKVGKIWFAGLYGWKSMMRHQIGLLLFLLSSALLVIRLRPPRPSRRRLWRQPGLAACAAAVLGVAINALNTGVETYSSPEQFWSGLDRIFWGPWPYCGPAVAGSWLALLVSGCWRAERGGIDRLGRLVGACWLAEALVAEMPGSKWIDILYNVLLR